jgi:hypothetical protein
VAAALAAGLTISLPLLAYAQPGEVSASDKELARRLLDEGDKAYEAGRFPEAVQKYCQADKIMGVPVTALECGKALEGLNKLLDAKEAYLRAAHYKHPAGQKEPDAFVSAREAAQQKTDSLGPRIPELLITIKGVEPGTPVTIKVDGQPLRADIPRRLVNPAPHEHLVSASAPGYRDASTTVSAKEGEQKPVTLELVPGKSGPPITPDPKIEPNERPKNGDTKTPPDRKGGPPVAALIGFGIGAAGLLTGAITGGMSLAQTSSLRKDCEAAGGSIDKCPEIVTDAQERHDRANALANAANATLVIGGVGVVFGVVALFVFKPSEPKKDASLTPLIGPGTLGVRGSF